MTDQSAGGGEMRNIAIGHIIRVPRPETGRMAVYRVTGIYVGATNQEDVVGLEVLDVLPPDHPTVRTAQVLVPLVMLQQLEVPCCQDDRHTEVLRPEGEVQEVGALECKVCHNGLVDIGSPGDPEPGPCPVCSQGG